MSNNRVVIPMEVSKTIAEISKALSKKNSDGKALSEKHSDEEIYTMLLECNMNADETVEKMLYLDTFHMVTRKPRKHENARTYEGSKWSGARGQRPRAGQGNYYSQNSNGAGVVRKPNARRENGFSDRPQRDHKSPLPAAKKTSNVTDPSMTKSSSAPHGIAKGTQAGVRNAKSSETNLEETSVKPSQAQSLVASSELVEGSSVLDGQSSEQRNSLPEVVASDSATSSAGDSAQSLNEPGVPSLESSTKLLDVNLKKLNISSYQPVIFPEHLQVPEELRFGLTFGSFGSPSDQEVEPVNESAEVEVPSPAAEPLHENEDVGKDASLSKEMVSSSAQESDYPVNSHSPPRAPENSSHLEDDVPSDAKLNDEQPKQEMRLPLGGNQYPFAASPNYGFAFAGPMLGNQIVQSEGIGQQSEGAQVSSATPATSQPAALSPPPFPIFRNPYQQHGYMPFSPYYHPYYYTSTGQPFLGQGGFPQQPSTGIAAYQLAAAAVASGGKFPMQPSQSGLNAGSAPQYAAGFGSYSPGLGPTSGGSAGNQDLTPSAFKDNTVYTTTVQQADGSSLVWPPPSVRDISGLPASSFYNPHVPQGHRVVLPPSQGGYASGVYHQPQAMAGSTANAHPQMQHLSQTMAGPNEAMRSGSGVFNQQQQQQHQAQRNALNWSPNY